MKHSQLLCKAAGLAVCAMLLVLCRVPVSAQTVVATIPAENGVMGTAMTITVNPFTQLVYIAGNGVEVVDERTNQPVTTISVGQNGLLASAINPVTRKLYVADLNSGVYIIDLTTNTVVANYAMPVMRGMAYNPVTNLVYAMDNFENLWVLDGNTAALVKELPAPANSMPGYSVTVNPATNLLYIPLQTAPGTMYVVNPATGVFTTASLTGSYGGFVEVDPLRNIVYISDTWIASDDDSDQIGQMEVMNGATNTDTTVITPIPLGNSDFSVDPVKQLLYLSDEDGNVYVIDGKTNTLTSTVIPVGTNPIHSAIDLVHGLLYVGNTALFQPGTPSVSVIKLK
jgi:DNA-binding beta-propeller fold protein YncE